MMPMILALAAMSLMALAFVGLWVGVRMLRPSARSRVKRNAVVAGSWKANLMGVSPVVSGHETASCTGVTTGKNGALRSASRVSDEALLDATS
jgi:hypothetical protein